VAVSDRIRERSRRRARRQLQDLGTELRDVRVAAGLSQAHVARAAGLTQTRVSRIERGQGMAARLDELVAQGAALGLRISTRAYPDGSPARDAGQLRLLARFRARIGPQFSWRTEVPIGGYGDLRAWDARLDGPISGGIDAETRLHDLQAVQRRIETKWRDSGVERIVLLVARSRHNTAMLRLHREALASTLPADTREIMLALQAGRIPRRNGLVVI
jgi:transcriptional regulator with XRE-family HTH domain